MMERLHRLTAAWGPAGREQRIAELLQEMIAPFADEIRTDRFGNLLAMRRGSGEGARVMLSAHMDTMGAIALEANDQGLIRVAPVGGLRAQHAQGQRVLWGGGPVGILQHEPVEDPKEIDFKRIWCDIGASSREEALENVALGDICTLVGDLQVMGDLVAGPGLDNRVGCAVLLQVAEHLGACDHDVAFAFTCQGKVGPRGSGVAAYGLTPDIAFTVDLAAAEVPGGSRRGVSLGGGPALKLKDGGFMSHRALADLVQRTADDFSIPLQIEIGAGHDGPYDAQTIAQSGQGVPTAVIDIPGRYGGTALEVVNIRDLHGAADLLLKLLGSPLQF